MFFGRSHKLKKCESSRRTYPAGQIVKTSREVRSFDETEHKATREQATKVLTRRSCRRDDTPDNHTNWKIECRFTHLVEVKVGRKLHQNVSNEEDGNAGLYSWLVPFRWCSSHSFPRPKQSYGLLYFTMEAFVGVSPDTPSPSTPNPLPTLPVSPPQYYSYPDNS